ncbi:MAG: hypothetical protein GF418_04450, partial [Chitinivibrionales bacterium]|nr:hypothetical protein [Chitinivibrionales bacterium]MBD3394858.1 hypothetical protein [Chitinivibrionales bacterium]
PHQGDNHQGNPLDGGWYDAGDFVKFGLPLGFTVYTLLKGYDVFPEGYDDNRTWNYQTSPDGIPDILNEVKVATDYLIKAVISQNTVVMDVGDAFQDHQVWSDGYGASSARTVYTATGADVPGLYAAALALMSQLYEPYDADYAQTCLDKAKQAYGFCSSHKNLSTNFQTDPGNGNKPYYDTDTWQDKMACGAVELYRATDNESYLDDAKTLMAEVGQHYAAVGYASCGDLAGFELYRLGETVLANPWLSDVNYAVSNRVVDCSGGSCQLVDGACVVVNWGVAGNAANAAFSAALAYMVKGDNKYRDFVYQQVKWVAGLSPFSRSWITRYGTSAPQNPHHRNDANSSVNLVGGIVSGPTANVDYMDPAKADTYQWTFSDNVALYENTEVAIDYNAGAIGALAFIRYYESATCERIDQALNAEPEQVDFTAVSAVSISATLENSNDWSVVLTGRQSGATKSFSGTGSSISKTWEGGADQGSFQPGEMVDISLEVDGVCGYHQGRTSTSILLQQLKEQAFRDSDVLVDDFEDNNFANEMGGDWEGFSDKSDSVAGGKSSTPYLSLTDNGRDESKGLRFRMTASSGAERPYAGVRTYFTSSGESTSLGLVKSVVFDVNPSSDNTVFRVEFEQSDIDDGAYFGHDVTAHSADAWQRVRLSSDHFEQPDWTGGDQSFRLDKIRAFRFIVYDGSASITVDNLHMEDLDLGAPVLSFGGPRTAEPHSFSMRGGAIEYMLPVSRFGEAPAEVRIVDLCGRTVYHRFAENASAQEAIHISTTAFAAGTYVLTCTVDGTPAGQPHRFAVSR